MYVSKPNRTELIGNKIWQLAPWMHPLENRNENVDCSLPVTTNKTTEMLMSNILFPYFCLWKYCIQLIQENAHFLSFCFVLLLFLRKETGTVLLLSIFCQSMITPNGIFSSVFWSYFSDRAPSSRNHPTALIGHHFKVSFYITKISKNILTFLPILFPLASP